MINYNDLNVVLLLQQTYILLLNWENDPPVPEQKVWPVELS